MALTRREVLAGGISAAVLSLLPQCKKSETQFGDEEMGPFDVCVIGSGFAGTHLALELVAAGYRTALVEAGSEFASDTSRTFPVESVGEIDYSANATRAIKLGGTSTRWRGKVNRLRPSDFRLSSSFGMEVDWPITYEDLAPYYCRAETALFTTGRAVIPGAEPPRSCDYPVILAGPYTGPELMHEDRPIPFFALAKSKRNGNPVRLVDEELPRLKRAPNAELFSDHRVARLVTTDGGSISHAEVQAPGGVRKLLHARCFIVAAGVIESPRLLLMSASTRFPHGLGNDSGLLGCNFVEHPSRTLRFESSQASEWGGRASSYLRVQ